MDNIANETTPYSLREFSFSTSSIMAEFSTTSYDNATGETPPTTTHDYLETWLIPTIFFLITFIGVVGNLLVIYFVVRHGQMKTVTNYYIVNLAFTDVSFLVCCAPFTAIIYAIPSWIFGRFMCKFVFFMMTVRQSRAVNVDMSGKPHPNFMQTACKSHWGKNPQAIFKFALFLWINLSQCNFISSFIMVAPRAVAGHNSRPPPPPPNDLYYVFKNPFFVS